MVGKICTVCRRCSYANKQLSFFTYPGDPFRRYEWLVAVDRLDLLEKLNNHRTRGNHRICEVHFEPKYVKKSKVIETRKCLSKDAYPTLCLARSNMTTAMYNNVFYREQNGVPHSKKLCSDQSSTKPEPTNSNQVSTPSRYNLRPSKKDKKYVDTESIEEGDTEDNIYYKVQTELLSELETQQPFYVDPSQYCESEMKVTQSTQTPGRTQPNFKFRSKYEYHSVNQKVKKKATYKDDSILEISSQYLSPRLCKLLKWRLSRTDSKEQINLNLFALNLYYSSNLYNLLQDMLSLPSMDTVKEFLLPKTTRISEHFLNAFRCKINNMSSKERICCFSVSSVMLKPELYYNIKYDRIIGLHDINGVQNIFLAKYAVLLMVHGIVENWQQPIAYAFISEYDHAPEISQWIDEVMKILIDIGLDIRVFVSDPRSEFLYAAESRFVTPEKPFFSVNGTDIFYTYDTPQLLRIVKNNLESCDFYYGDNDEVNNNFDFLIKISNLCNTLNSKLIFSNSQHKRAFSNKKSQRYYLMQMLHLFQNLRVVRKIDDVDVTENMKFIEGFQVTINSVLQLYEELNFLGVKYLLTCRLNLNRLHRVLAREKRDNPKIDCTPRLFNRGFVRSFVFNLLTKPVASCSNSENLLDPEEFSRQLLDEEFHEGENIKHNQPLLVQTTDYRELMPERNAFFYVARYCYVKCVQVHNCQSFQTYLNGSHCKQETDIKVEPSLSVSLGDKLHNSAGSPPKDFTEFLKLLDTKYKEYFNPNISMRSIGQEMVKELEQYGFGMPCPCFPIDYLKALFVRVRLFYTIRKNNKLCKKRKNMKVLKAFNL